MVLEVLGQGNVPNSAQAVAYLKRHPAAIQHLTRYRTVLRDLRQARVSILPLSYRDLHASRQHRERDGLLTNGSVLVAVMLRERILHLATNDPDFERMAGITVCVPGEGPFRAVAAAASRVLWDMLGPNTAGHMSGTAAGRRLSQSPCPPPPGSCRRR
jgi:hypothetical protein